MFRLSEGLKMQRYGNQGNCTIRWNKCTGGREWVGPLGNGRRVTIMDNNFLLPQCFLRRFLYDASLCQFETLDCDYST